jgi:hypothetical protein
LLASGLGAETLANLLDLTGFFAGAFGFAAFETFLPLVALEVFLAGLALAGAFALLLALGLGAATGVAAVVALALF